MVQNLEKCFGSLKSFNVILHCDSAILLLNINLQSVSQCVLRKNTQEYSLHCSHNPKFINCKMNRLYNIFSMNEMNELHI